MEVDYSFLTQEQLEEYGLDDVNLPSVQFLDDYGLNHHNYGEDVLSDIDYDLAQERLLEGKTLLFNRYAKQLTVDDDPIKGKNGILLVKCKYCNKHFYPTKPQLTQRIAYLNNLDYGQRHLYCSDNCKSACPLFGTLSKRDYEYSKQAREIALEMADYKCEICGTTERLQVHHIKPFKTDPVEAYDIDNLVVLCSGDDGCHIKYGHSDRNCTLSNLKSCKSP